MLTVKDACNYLGVSRRTIYRLIQSGKLSGKKVGGEWYFEQSAVDKLRKTPPQYPLKPDLMTLKEVCIYLGVSKDTVYRLINNKKLPAVKSGGQWRFAKDDVKQFLTGGREVPTHIWGADFEGGVMGLSEASKYLGVHRDTVYRLIKDGKIPASKVGGVWRLIKTELSRYLLKRRHSYGIISTSPLVFWSNVLDKYLNDLQTYYIKDNAYDGFVGSRQDYYDYKTLSAIHAVMEWDRFFVDLHYRKVAVKGGVVLLVAPKQYEMLPAKEQIHWSQHRLSESQTRGIEL